MSVRLAKKTGFCFGVKRAVAMAEKALAKSRPIYSLGSIIHNRQVVEALSKKGLKVINNINEIKKGVFLISSHGLSPKTYRAIAERGLKIIDTTCPFVLNAQRIAGALSREGYTVVIVGDANHPEVRALVDFAARNVFVVKDRSEARKLKIGRNLRVSVISQTTQSKSNFLDVVREIAKKDPAELKVSNTICKDALTRQAYARDLSRKVDTMFVVGGRNSANTKRLLDVCVKYSKAVYLIEDGNEVKKDWIKDSKSIGITSGASTPDWVVEEVVDRINSKFKSKKSKLKGKSKK